MTDKQLALYLRGLHEQLYELVQKQSPHIDDLELRISAVASRLEDDLALLVED